MLNEISSIFIGGYALILLWGVKSLAAGEQAYLAFLDGLTSPLSLTFHWVALGFTLLNSVSWFGVTPKAMPVQIGDEFLPGHYIAIGHYVAWFCVSLVVLVVSGVFSNG